MAQVFNLTAVGDTMTEGDVVEWFVDVGDVIAIDQAICSVETDKSVVELTSPFAGTVLSLGVEAGQTLAVGEPLITVGEPGESVPQASGAGPSGDCGATPDEPPSPGPLVRKLAERLSVELADVVGTGPGGRVTRDDVESIAASSTTAASGGDEWHPVLAMPKVRRAARQRSIDLATIAGTGPRGSITLNDLDSRAVQPAAAVPSSGHPAPDERIPMSRMRRTIAANLTRRWQEVPHVTGHVDADGTALLALRSELSEQWGEKVPIDALVLALCVPILGDFPAFRSHVEGDELVVKHRYDFGIAVDTDEGLVVPVIRSVDSLTIRQLGNELRRLADRARRRELAPADLDGNVFTVSNLGPVGVGHATSITPDGTSALLSVGRATPAWIDGPDRQPVRSIRVPLSMTADHRAIDGGEIGRFLTRLAAAIEQPVASLLR